MAMRGGPRQRLTGNPLGGIIRDLDRRTRSTTRRSRAVRATDPVPGRPTPPASGAVGASAGPLAAVIVTGPDGRARWQLPTRLDRPPVVTALPLDTTPGDGESTVIVTLEDVTTWYVLVRVWRTRPRRDTGVAAPEGEGVHVHVTATEPSHLAHG